MGFNKLFIPEINSLKEELMTKGNEQFFKDWSRRYVKADAIIGSEESIEFIKQFIVREYDITSNGSISKDAKN
jgi:hypothetical protein